MAAGYFDIFVERGSTYDTQITLNDDNGDPLNLTNHAVKGQAKKSYYANSTTVTFDTAIVDATNGVIELAMSANVTIDLPPGKLVYDVYVKDSANNIVTRVLEGQVFVSPNVTAGF
jgi:hypothetical protein